jgi:FkbM family methyltransferase
MQIVRKIPKKLRFLLFWVYAGSRRWVYLRRQKAGQPINFRLGSATAISLYPEGQIAELLYTARFERVELALVNDYLKPGMNVIDIGANIGLYSILADKAITPGGQVWAFEPSAESYERLLRNLLLNQAASVRPLKMALAGTPGGNLVLKREPGFRDGDRYLAAHNGVLPVSDQIGDSGDIENVPVDTLDHYFEFLADAPPKFDFLKMDIEGGEYSVFQGARKLLQANPTIVLMFECTPQGCQRAGHTQDEVFEFLRSLGFELYAWHRSGKRWDSSRGLLLSAGNVWACRDRSLLPRLP